ncbi:MAG: FG-GAP repeat protein, partial [Deltaproteobacteria bacterium]|nr:FG-GAP repeat protein [Deltaproteobacteria bacterium]
MTLIALLFATEAWADLPTTLEDIDLDATFTGEATFDYAGRTLSGAADVNGDGLPDLLVGAYGSDDGARGGGETYLVLGSEVRYSGSHGIDEADASWVGDTESEYTSLEIALAPDLDGDGFDDIAIGTYRNSDVTTESGKVYVVYGASGGWTANTSLASADASWLGQGEYDHVGRAVAGLGDVDGDGYGDLLVGGCWNSDIAYRAGKAFLLYGGSTRWTPDTSLSEAQVVLAGSEEEEFAARAVAGVGDVDGDGLADFLVGAYGNDDGGTDAGEAWLFFGGSLSGEIDLDSGADASFEGEAAGDRAGLVVASAGDVDADGYDDMLVAAYLNDRGAANAGAVFLVRGRASGLAPGTSLEEADAVLTGEDAYDYAGRSASGVGDVNGDGFDDVLVGATGADDGGTDAGRAYLVLGSASPTSCSLADADTLITGTEEGAEFPYVLAPAGDLDGGGNADIVLPAYMSGATAREAGVVYVLYVEPWIDQDGDGYSESEGDCDEGDAGIHPGATEVPFDGVDQDCDGADSYDADGDGYDSEDWGGDDCDDSNVNIHPGAVELCLDGVDNDCDGHVDWADVNGDGIDDCLYECPDPYMDPDQDDDGAVRGECGGNDCDDLDPDVFPGAMEIPYDGKDNDCLDG